MVRTASLDVCAAIVVLGLASAALPQLGFAQPKQASHAPQQGSWQLKKDHWIWVEQTPAQTKTAVTATDTESGKGPVHEAGLTLRRTIAGAMTAP